MAKRLKFYRLGIEFGAGERWKVIVHLWRWTWVWNGGRP